MDLLRQPYARELDLGAPDEGHGWRQQELQRERGYLAPDRAQEEEPMRPRGEGMPTL
jgi:hypothetical protein